VTFLFQCEVTLIILWMCLEL